MKRRIAALLALALPIPFALAEATLPADDAPLTTQDGVDCLLSGDYLYRVPDDGTAQIDAWIHSAGTRSGTMALTVPATVTQIGRSPFARRAGDFTLLVGAGSFAGTWAREHDVNTKTLE